MTCLILLRARSTSAGSLGAAGGTLVASAGSNADGKLGPLVRVHAAKTVAAANSASAERTSRRRERIPRRVSDRPVLPQSPRALRYACATDAPDPVSFARRWRRHRGVAGLRGIGGVRVRRPVGVHA